MGDEEDEAAVKGALSWPYELYIHGGAIALAAEDAVRQVGFAPETEDVHVTVLYFGEACCTSGRLVRIRKVLDRLWYEYMNEQSGMDFFLTPWGECSLRVRGPLEQLILRLREEYPSDVEQRPPHVAVANRRGTENREQTTDKHTRIGSCRWWRLATDDEIGNWPAKMTRSQVTRSMRHVKRKRDRRGSTSEGHPAPGRVTRPAEHVRVIICGSDRCAEVCATRASRSFRYEETKAQGTSLHSAVETVHGAGCRVQGCRFVRLFVCCLFVIEY